MIYKEDLILKKAYITTLGIHFEGLYYSCGYALRQKWFESTIDDCDLQIYQLPSESHVIYIPIHENFIVTARVIAPMKTPKVSEITEYQKQLNQMKELLRKKRHAHLNRRNRR